MLPRMNPLHVLAYRVSDWNRKRKWVHFLTEFRPTPEARVLDVGFQDRSFHKGDNYIEENYPWRKQLTALGIVEPDHFARRYPDVKVVVYDGGQFPFPDQAFDIVWSNAVVEHVGDREAQLNFLSECARVGRRMFLTTPNRYFPVEVHTRIPLLHWLPKSTFDGILRRLGKGRFAGEYMNLLSARQLRRLLADAGLGEARIKRNRFLGFTMDFVVVT